MFLSDNILLNNATNNIFNYVNVYYILIFACVCSYMGFPGGSAVKNLPANAGDAGSILGQEDPLVKEMANCSSIFV